MRMVSRLSSGELPRLSREAEAVVLVEGMVGEARGAEEEGLEADRTDREIIRIDPAVEGIRRSHVNREVRARV